MEEKQKYEKRLNMIFERNRLESFKHWPYSEKRKCNIPKMAEAGFFWTGTEKEPDSAQCFVCNKQMDGWESTDDPWKEHKSHADKCPFVKIGKQEELLTVMELTDLWKSMIKTIVLNEFKTVEKQMLEGYGKVKTDILYFQKNGTRSKK